MWVSRMMHMRGAAGTLSTKAAFNAVSRSCTRGIHTTRSSQHRVKAREFVKRTRETAKSSMQAMKEDPPLMLMNLGAVISLTGFMMTDMLVLRIMSMGGGVCGMVYNFTRNPPQRNAVLWGLIFFSVNAVNVVRILLDRREPKFSQREHELYSHHFKEFGVQPHQFVKLLEIGTWEERAGGEVLVHDGKPLSKLYMLHAGSAAAYKPQQASKPLYTYKGEGTNGSVIGGTALVDASVTTRDYPNRIVAVDETEYIVWDIEQLLQLLSTDKLIESAFIHSLYVDLLKGLRRDRQKTGALGQNKAEAVSLKLEAYTQMMMNAIKTSETQPPVMAAGPKRELLRFAKENGITNSQRDQVLASFGWSKEDWICGAKA